MLEGFGGFVTPDQHETLALKMRVHAQQILLDWLADTWNLRGAGLPASARSDLVTSFERKLSAARQENLGIALPWLDAASSDLQSALFQESFDEASQRVMKIIKEGAQ